MEQLNNIKIKYTHPACPPEDIHVGWIYTLLYKDGKYFIDDGNLEQEMELKKIQQLFSPIDTSWQKLIAEEARIKKYKNINS